MTYLEVGSPEVYPSFPGMIDLGSPLGAGPLGEPSNCISCTPAPVCLVFEGRMQFQSSLQSHTDVYHLRP